MSSDRFEVRIWGARGSLPVAGPQFALFGGNTICVEVRCGDHVLLFDAGSGFPIAGAALLAEGVRDFNVFLTHCHYDHVIGLPFFKPLYTPGAEVAFWSGHMAGEKTTKQILIDFMAKPFFPVGPDVCLACLHTHDFRAGDVLEPYPGVTIRTFLLHHPGHAIGYRIEFGGRAIAMAFDTDHVEGQRDQTVLQLIDGVDLFLYDATFTDAEFFPYRYFGHSTWEEGVRLAQESGAKRVGFLHHATYRTDDQLLRIEADAQALFAGAFCCRDFQVIPI